MPNYKAHSINMMKVLPNIDSKVDLKEDELKIFAFGPDALMLTDNKLFEKQHRYKTREYFQRMIKTIKEDKLSDDSQVMGFLYGQLDHFTLDLIMHPLIYYMTERIPQRYKIPPHALLEFWIDDYVIKKNNIDDKKFYQSNVRINKNLTYLINKIYKKVYRKDNIKTKYDVGYLSFLEFESIIRKSKASIFKLICDFFKIGDIFYNKDLKRVLPYLNLDHKMLRHPVTGEYFNLSFDDLWDKSIQTSSELIEDVNNDIYHDKVITNPLITDNISYNTGLPCKKRVKLRYLKKYEK